jgi:hypothetical protein
MNEKKKQFFKVPQDIKTMTDEQLDQWADEIIQALSNMANQDESSEA